MSKRRKRWREEWRRHLENYDRRQEDVVRPPREEEARCARCRVPLEFNQAGVLAIALFTVRSIAEQDAPLLCLNCRAYELASGEKIDGK